MLYIVCALWRPIHYGPLYVSLFKKQKVISVPLDQVEVRVLHH